MCDPCQAVRPQCNMFPICNQGTGSTGPCNVSYVGLSTKGNIDKTFCIANCRAYYKFKKICYPYRVSVPVSINNRLDLVFNLLNVYTITLTVYPCGCPMAQLPINLEVVNPSPALSIETGTGPNSITITGEIPAGTIFRFYTDPNLLRYFTDIELVGKIEVSDAACQLNVITQRDNATVVEYISTRPFPYISLLPPIPFPAPGLNPVLPDQYPQSNSVFPWTEAIIPWKQNQPFPTGPNVIITPPSPVPPLPTLVNGYNDEYAKFRSVPDSVIFYLGYDAATVSPTQEDWTLFLRNFVDRGYAQTFPGQPSWQTTNYAKRQYMNALSSDKLQFYLEKINTFVNTAYTEVVSNRKPFTSSFQNNVVLFFLNMHIGFHEYPQYVIEYFSEFIEFVGIGDPNNARRNQLLIKGNMTAAKVFEYFKEKATEVISNEDKTSIAYWWNIAGLSEESLLFESVHNIVAFSQFSNVLYSVIYTSPSIHPINPLSPALPQYPDFLTLYANAATGNDRLNVVREAFRLLVPNSNSFSRVNPSTSLRSIQARHIHQQIMIQNNPGANSNQQTAVYFTYNPGLYAGFPANLDGLEGLTASNDFLVQLPTSERDQETVIDASNLANNSNLIIPIFAKPVYAPFGLGYRRCAGEVFVYLVTEKLLERFSQATYEERIGTFPTIYIAPFKGVPDNIFAKQPF